MTKPWCDKELKTTIYQIFLQCVEEIAVYREVFIIKSLNLYLLGFSTYYPGKPEYLLPPFININYFTLVFDIEIKNNLQTSSVIS